MRAFSSSGIFPFVLIFLGILSSARAACVTTQTVRQAGGGTCTTIQQCVNNIPSTALTGDWCINIQDSATYNEQVTIQNKNTNGFQIVISSVAGTSPIVNPPAQSTAAFLISNTSVTLMGIGIFPNNATSYGIAATSANVTISNVSVIDAGGKISYSGIYLSSQSSVSNSSVAVQAAFGLYVDGSWNLVANSTAVSQSAGLWIHGYSFNTVTQGYFSGSGSGVAVYLSTNSTFNTISQSTVVTNAGTYSALFLVDASSNIVVQDYIANSGDAARFALGSTYNTISQCTVVGGSSANGLYLFSSSSFNAVTQSFLSGGASGITLDAYADYSTISLSTVTSPTSSALYIPRASSNTITNSYLQGYVGADVRSTGTVINSSVLVGANSLNTGIGVSVSGGSANLSLSSDVVSGQSNAGAGIYLFPGNGGSISLSSITITGAQYGLSIATMASGATLSISSMIFTGMPAGGATTAIQFLGGTFVSTFSAVNFSANTIATNIDASRLSPGSAITMRGDSGYATGPAFANDPGHYVYWPDTLVFQTTQPANGTTLATFPTVAGTVTGGGGVVASVQVNISYNNPTLCWDSGSSAWTAACGFQAASGVSAWSMGSVPPANLLTNGTLYRVQAQALDSGNNALRSVSVTFLYCTGACNIVLSALPFSGVFANSLTANWNSTFPLAVANYFVQLSTGGFPNAFAGNKTMVTPQLSATFTGLSPGITYFAQVSTSATGPFTSLGSTTTIAGVIAPAAFSGVIYSGLTANWGSTFGPGTIYYSQLSTGAFPNSFSANISSNTANLFATFSNLASNTTYFAQVSTSPAGPFVSLGSTVTPAFVITPLPFTAVTATRLTANWTSTPLLSSYYAQLSTGAFPNTFSGNVAQSTIYTFITFTGLNGSTTYYVQVSSSATGPFTSLGFAVTLPSGTGPSPFTDLSAARAYPNPYKPNSGNPDYGVPYSPSNPNSGIIFDQLPTNVVIRIYSLAGRLVASANATTSAGKWQWNVKNDAGQDVASGLYFAVFSTSGQSGGGYGASSSGTAIKKVLIVR